jgi:hypothetical protein
MKIVLSCEQKLSISTDASNKGNIKLFTVAIHYFDVNEGLVNFIIDFYDDPNESSNDIYKILIKILNSNKYFFFEYDKNNECNLTLNECFLFFAHNYMKLFHESILILETKSINSVHILIYDIMCGLKTKLENRIRYKFYGSSLNSNLRKMSKK